MKSGVLLGAASMIDRDDRAVRGGRRPAASVVACGALADVVVPLCRREITVDSTLRIDGLYAAWRKNNV